MTPLPPEALDASRELAAELGQLIRIEGDTVLVPSRTVHGAFHKVIIGLDDETTCSCPAFENHGYCWAATYIKEELMTTTALTTIKVTPPPAALPSVDELKSMDLVAAQLAEGNAIAIPANLKTKQDIRAVIFAGWELGVKPMTALRHIAVINGKTEPDGQLMAGIVLAKEPDARFEVVEETEDSTTVRLTRPSRNIVREYTSTMEDAKRAGLLSKDGWAKYPRDMRRWSAIKRLCRAYCPDIINGIASVTLGDLPQAIAPEAEEEPFIEGEAHLVDSSLYNEGDEPPPNVDRETGEIREPITDEQKKRISALWPKNQRKWTEARQRWPHCFPAPEPGAMNRLAALSEAEAADVIAFFEGVTQESQASSPQAAASPAAAPASPPAEGATQAGVTARNATSEQAASGEALHSTDAAPLPASPPATDCDHEPAFDEDSTLMRCSKCGIALEEPAPAGQAPLIRT